MSDLDNPFFKMGEMIGRQNDELTAANKAIVALSEALEKEVERDGPECYIESLEALETHAPAIEKARGG